jgi:S1-C subfamily serine protease
VAPRLAAAAAAEASVAAAPAAPASGETAVRVPVQYVAATTGSLADEQNNIEVYERVNKSVVYITTITLEYSYFFEAMPQEGTGSGIIIDTEGHVLTNYHVVKGADQLRITLSDGTELEGKVTGTDPENDLAVVKFDPKGRVVVPVTFGSSSNLKVGQKVLAIGNPFGLDRTLTTGIISALGRPLQNTEENTVIRSAIQTDAAINPGNSGGPLIDTSGTVVGVSTAFAEGAQGIFFAIPINIAKPIMAQAVAGEDLTRPWIGIVYVAVDGNLAEENSLPIDYGAWIAPDTGDGQPPIVPGSPAEQAGLQAGDIVTAIDGLRIDAGQGLDDILSLYEPGDRLTLTVLRAGETLQIGVTLGTRPAGLE